MSLLTAPPERSTFTPEAADRPSSTAAASPPIPASIPAGYFTAPKESLSDRLKDLLNLRLLLLGAVVLFLIGAPFYVWAREALDGGIVNHGNYADVNLKAMSSFELDQVSGQPSDVPARFRALEGHRVALVGEMWLPREAGNGGIGAFQLVYSKTKCCFSGPPLAQHFVDATVVPGRSAEYYDGMVRVWGTLHIHFRMDGGVIKSVYAVDVDKVEPL